jgi:hypothetical protein
MAAAARNYFCKFEELAVTVFFVNSGFLEDFELMSISAT